MHLNAVSCDTVEGREFIDENCTLTLDRGKHY